jgi:hypothetical protein
VNLRCPPCRALTRGGLRMTQNRSNEEIHARYCALRNPRFALVLVVCFSVLAFVSWRDLHKPPPARDFIQLPFAILLVAISAKLLAIFKCFRERLILGLAIASFVSAEISEFAPAIVRPFAGLVNSGDLAVSGLALLVSFTMLFQSVRNPHVETREGEARMIGRRLLILCAVIVAVLLLGAMLYFAPLGQ